MQLIAAVTLQVGGNEKVYNSADKIFEISSKDPIALMVYNSLEINGVPIEVISKKYRDKHCSHNAKSVEEFSEKFLEYLSSLPAPKHTIDENIYLSIAPELENIKEICSLITTSVLQNLSNEDQPLEKIQNKILNELHTSLTNRLSEIKAHNPLPWAKNITVDDILHSHSDTIDPSIEFKLKGLFIPDKIRQLAKQIAAETLLRGTESDHVTGLVFAGFGQEEMFPTLISYEVYGITAGKLKYRKIDHIDIDRTKNISAEIIPFAQQDVSDRFIYELDAPFLEITKKFFQGSLNAFCSSVKEFIETRDLELANALAPVLSEASIKMMEEFQSNVVPDQLHRSKQQIADMVRFMPKQELATLAESLVHITSLKRRFSAEAESVGGPIDVVMITRSEGLVWIKRKHYFDPALNPRYFYRRYGVGKPPVAGEEA